MTRWFGPTLSFLLICVAAYLVASYFRTPELPHAELPDDWNPGCEKLDLDWVEMPTAHLADFGWPSRVSYAQWNPLWSDGTLYQPYSIGQSRLSDHPSGMWRKGPNDETITREKIGDGYVDWMRRDGDTLWAILVLRNANETHLLEMDAITLEVRKRVTLPQAVNSCIDMPDGSLRLFWVPPAKQVRERYWATFDLATGTLGPAERFPVDGARGAWLHTPGRLQVGGEDWTETSYLDLATGKVEIAESPWHNRDWDNPPNVDRGEPVAFARYDESRSLGINLSHERELFIVGSVPEAHQRLDLSYDDSRVVNTPPEHLPWLKHPWLSARTRLWHKRLGDDEYGTLLSTPRIEAIRYYSPTDPDFEPRTLECDLPLTLQAAQATSPYGMYSSHEVLSVLRANAHELILAEIIPVPPSTVNKGKPLIRFGSVADDSDGIEWLGWLPQPFAAPEGVQTIARVTGVATTGGVMFRVTVTPWRGMSREPSEIAWVEIPWDIDIDRPVGWDL